MKKESLNSLARDSMSGKEGKMQLTYMQGFIVPESMMAVVTTAEGGFDKLDYREVAVPKVGPNQVLLRVLAAGVNNTEINTRLGWYSRSVTDGTLATNDDQNANTPTDGSGGWNGHTPFPIIQGTDCCGEVVGCHNDGPTSLLGRRVLVRACMRTDGFQSFENTWMASNFDGAFATYVVVPAAEVFPVNCDWSDAELATIPCAYATAETMLERAKCTAGDIVLVTGASGGVGSATIQLAKRRGAYVIGLTSASKIEDVKSIGCDHVIDRTKDLVTALDGQDANIVVDNVAGDGFATLLKIMARGGRYASSGAIAGPMVQLDMRDLYLRDITMFGSTAWDEPIFPNLIRYIEAGEIRPLLFKTYPLKDIVEAQKFFMRKDHIGNVVLLP